MVMADRRTASASRRCRHVGRYTQGLIERRASRAVARGANPQRALEHYWFKPEIWSQLTQVSTSDSVHNWRYVNANRKSVSPRPHQIKAEQILKNIGLKWRRIISPHAPVRPWVYVMMVFLGLCHSLHQRSPTDGPRATSYRLILTRLAKLFVDLLLLITSSFNSFLPKNLKKVLLISSVALRIGDTHSTDFKTQP
jgi:hypothetical protein